MAIFLDVSQVYRLLQRELPEGAYPDGAPSGYYSTASIYSKATLIEAAYENLELIYNNFFPQTATEKLLDWEQKAFGEFLDSSLSIAERRDRVIAKLRKRPGITKADMLAIVYSVIGSDKIVEIINWGCGEGGWSLGVSQLGINTYLNPARLSDVTAFLYPAGDFCDEDKSQFGKTDEEWALMQETAYTFEILIYDYTLTALELAKLNTELYKGAPARSAYVITDGLDSADMIEED